MCLWINSFWKVFYFAYVSGTTILQYGFFVLKIWATTLISAFSCFFLSHYVPHSSYWRLAECVTGAMTCCWSAETANGWNLQTGDSVLKYTANNRVWAPIRVQYMRTTGANGPKQNQLSHFRCEQKENRGSVNSWWRPQTVQWDTILTITVSTKTGVPTICHNISSIITEWR